MRHAIHDLWPIFRTVTPQRRQCVAFNATVDKSRAAFTQCRKIDMVLLRCAHHLRSDRRHVVDRFAANEQENQRKGSTYSSFQNPIPKIVRTSTSGSSAVF